MSTANGKAAANGAAAVFNTTTVFPVKTETPVKPLPKLDEPKPEQSRTEPATPEAIEKRLARFAELERLKERRDQVTDALDDLNNFHLSNAGSASLRLTDSRNTTFNISHPLVIADMVASAKAKLAAEVAAIDAQFLV